MGILIAGFVPRFALLGAVTLRLCSNTCGKCKTRQFVRLESRNRQPSSWMPPCCHGLYKVHSKPSWEDIANQDQAMTNSAQDESPN